MIKRIITIAITVAIAAHAQGQNQLDAKIRPGNGLEIRLNDGDYTFNLGGFIQSTFRYLDPATGEAENKFGVKRGFFSLAGEARAEKLNFLLQMDFAATSPLLDAWLAYRPLPSITVSAGQKQTFTNNREMTLAESHLAMTDRSPLSLLLSGAGREFGIFVEGRFAPGGIPVLPALAVTSGDGLNAFGSTSIDVDLGGLKYGGRIDVLPLGDFIFGNENNVADLARERAPRLKIGIAASYNRGASHPVGEGHGAFTLYDEDGVAAYPDYRKVYVDLLFKYRGLSLLGEYANSSATALQRLYTAPGGVARLLLGQVSHYLRLGNAYNLQAGYALPSGWALDLRYTRLSPEFKQEAASLLRRVDLREACITKYFADNRFKVQGSVAREERDGQERDTRVELLVQILF
ncbi:MAG: porin [Odoribacteraceae bacterium]|jgi:hypothetical protein|nr:porin [Odoribacteraceae bacterium]